MTTIYTYKYIIIMLGNLNKTRSVINKFTNTPSDITKDVCVDGEIVISNKKGQEGIYIKNTDNEIVKIVDNSHQYISKTDYDSLVERGEIDENIYYMIYED